jgi:uncharacterized protein YvpB
MKRRSGQKCLHTKLRLAMVSVFAVSAIVCFLYYHEWKQVLDVPYVSQKDSYATGCELVSATMVLKYYGYNVSVQDVVAKTPFEELKQENGKLTGPHPSEVFIGDPTSENGFGCYAPVVAQVMNSVIQQDGSKRAVDITGMDFDALLPYIRKGDPVLVWATMNMTPSYAGKSWVLKKTGKKFVWPAREHCLVLVGYDQNQYYFNDPYESNGLIGYEKELVRLRYDELGRQAVVVESS